MAQCCVNRRQLFEHLRVLRESGFIQVHSNPPKKNEYSLNLETMQQSAQLQPCRKPHGKQCSEAHSEPCSTAHSDHAENRTVTMQKTADTTVQDSARSYKEEPLFTEPSVEPPGEQEKNHTPLPPGAEDYKNLFYDDYITALAIEFSEIRRETANHEKVSHDAIEYYSGLITDILTNGEATEESLKLLISWFRDSEEGQDTWTYGMGSLVNAHIHRVGRSCPNYKQHVLRRNIADYLGRANSWKKGKSARKQSSSASGRYPTPGQRINAQIATHDPANVLPPEEQEIVEGDY